jgi:hypothetical protein
MHLGIISISELIPIVEAMMKLRKPEFNEFHDEKVIIKRPMLFKKI